MAGVLFGNDVNIRGCFMRKELGPDRGYGAQIRLPDETIIPTQENRFSDPRMVVGISYNMSELVAFLKTFGDRTFTYAFGHDPTTSILGVELLGFVVNKSEISDVFTRMNDAYRLNRISAAIAAGYANQRVILSLGNNVMSGFLLRMDSRTANPETGIQAFNLVMSLTEVQ